MGADGGVNWVRVKDKKRFRELIRPFRIHWDSDGYKGSNLDYIDNNPLPDDYEVSTYGTDQELHGFDTLREMLDEATYIEDYDLGEDATFVDLLIADYTYPQAWGPPLPSVISRAIVGRSLRLYADNDRLREWAAGEILKAVEKASHDPILTMSIKEWARAVTEVIYPKSFGSVETWT
jgi:hypothetical protein